MNTQSTILSQRPFNFLLLMLGLIGLAPIACGESNEIGEPRLINGPMIGVVTPDEVTIWGRVMGEFTFSVLYDTDPDMRAPTPSGASPATRRSRW